MSRRPGDWLDNYYLALFILGLVVWGGFAVLVLSSPSGCSQ